MTNPRRPKRWVAVVVLLLVVAIAAVVGGMSAIHAPYGYTLEAEFAELPADDTRLEQWLSERPGVDPDWVRISRTGPQRNVLHVHFVQVRSLLGGPAFPALDQACADLGYGPRKSLFHDAVRLSSAARESELNR